MSKKINLTLAAAFAMAAVSVVPAMAGDNGYPCTVGQTNCVADDPDDPSQGHYSTPTGQTTTTTINGETGETTTTTSPTPAPAPAPSPDSPPSVD